MSVATAAEYALLQVLGATAVMYLGKPGTDRHRLADRVGCHVAAGQQAGKDVRRGG
jgi:hypothetical protein